MKKIKNGYLLQTYIKKFLRRGQVCFNNLEDIEIFQELIWNIPHVEMIFEGGVIFAQAWFNPHYTQTCLKHFNPTETFSFN